MTMPALFVQDLTSADLNYEPQSEDAEVEELKEMINSPTKQGYIKIGMFKRLEFAEQNRQKGELGRQEKRALQELMQQRELEQRERITALREKWGDKDTEAMLRVRLQNVEKAKLIRGERQQIMQTMADRRAETLQIAQDRVLSGGGSAAIDARLDAAEAEIAARHQAEAREATRVRLEAQRVERERDAAYKAALAVKVHEIHERADKAGEVHFNRQQQRALAARDERKRFADKREAKEEARLEAVRQRRAESDAKHKQATAAQAAKAEARRELARKEKEYDKLQVRRNPSDVCGGAGNGVGGGELRRARAHPVGAPDQERAPAAARTRHGRRRETRPHP